MTDVEYNTSSNLCDPHTSDTTNEIFWWIWTISVAWNVLFLGLRHIFNSWVDCSQRQLRLKIFLLCKWKLIQNSFEVSINYTTLIRNLISNKSDEHFLCTIFNSNSIHGIVSQLLHSFDVSTWCLKAWISIACICNDFLLITKWENFMRKIHQANSSFKKNSMKCISIIKRIFKHWFAWINLEQSFSTDFSVRFMWLLSFYLGTRLS